MTSGYFRIYHRSSPGSGKVSSRLAEAAAVGWPSELLLITGLVGNSEAKSMGFSHCFFLGGFRISEGFPVDDPFNQPTVSWKCGTKVPSGYVKIAIDNGHLWLIYLFFTW